MKTKGIGKTILFLVFAFGLSLLLQPGTSLAKEAGDKVLAKVGHYTLTMKQFQNQIDNLPPQLQVAIAHNSEMKEQFLQRWVQITLLAEAARSEGLEKDPEVKAQIQELKNTILAQAFAEKALKNKVKVTDKEVTDYYNAHKDEFTTPEQVKARHILVKVPADSDKKVWEQAKEKASKIRQELLKGADFGKLAKQYSGDPGTKDQGGDLGYFAKGRMIPEFEKAAFSLEVGQISQPVKTVFGYHIIQIEDKKPAKVRSFDQVQNQIRHKLTMEKQGEVLEKIMAQLKAKYPVELHKELLKEDDGKSK